MSTQYVELSDYLEHHGIKGQKWGVRRYQNEDGSLTEAGKRRYHSDSSTLGVYAYLSKRGGENLSTSEKLRATKLIRKAQKNKIITDKEVSDLENIVEKITPNVLSNEIKNQKSRLLLDSKEGWIETLKARKEYEDLLNRSLSDVGLDKYYKAGAFVSQHYADLTAPMYLKKSKNGKFEDPDFVKEDPDLSKFGVTRWFNGYDSLKDYYNAWDEDYEERRQKKVKHSSEDGTNFKMEPKYLELSSVLASLNPEYLEHHGIKGMNWGVRRGPPYPLKSGLRTKIKKVTQAAKNRVEQNRKQRAARKEAKEAKRRKKNPTLQDRISAMSDEELRQRTDRLRLENAYKRELPNEKQGESFLRKSSKALNELKAFGDAVSGFIETGKRVSHAFGLDKLDGDDQNPNRRPGESLKDYTQRMAQLASLKKSWDTLKTASSSSSSSDSEKEKKVTSPTFTARKSSTSEGGSWWKQDNVSSDDPRLSDLRDEAKKWNVDIDRPVERVWDYSDKGNDWFKESFPSGGKPSSRSIDFTKDDDDEKKKKGG